MACFDAPGGGIIGAKMPHGQMLWIIAASAKLWFEAHEDGKDSACSARGSALEGDET